MVKVSAVLGVRKGAWTREEDDLLRKCIHTYGEGKWHQVPLRAGLNRCRKSCRLRWLNYLRPNIKRGDFTCDEVDLIMRLHKLLGNRWSLIAGRLPGRTANDVKNYWNSHLKKELGDNPAREKPKTQTQTTIVIKPQPRTIAGNVTWLTEKDATLQGANPTQSTNGLPSSKFLPEANDDSYQWWNKLIVDNEIGSANSWSIGNSEQQPLAGLWTGDISPGIPKSGDSSACVHEGQSGWNDLSMDMEIWDLLNSEQVVL